MQQQQQQYSIYQRGVRVLTVAVLLIAGSLLVNFTHQVIQHMRLEEQQVQLATEVAHLAAQHQELEAAVAYVESDAYVERVAREQLGFAQQDDMVIYPQFATVTATPLPMPHTLAPPTTPPNWQRWWHALFP